VSTTKGKTALSSLQNPFIIIPSPSPLAIGVARIPGKPFRTGFEFPLRISWGFGWWRVLEGVPQ